MQRLRLVLIPNFFAHAGDQPDGFIKFRQFRPLDRFEAFFVYDITLQNEITERFGCPNTEIRSLL